MTKSFVVIVKSVMNAVCSRTGLLKSQDVLPVVDVF